MRESSKLNRRQFLKLACAGTCGGVIHNVLTPANRILAFASPPTAPMLGGNPIMILVNLAGGNSYNIAPPTNADYIDRMRELANLGPNDGSHQLTTEQHLHPSLVGLKQIWDESHLAVINMVGYDTPNRSHAESTDIWFAGANSGRDSISTVSGGWAARLTCQIGTTFAGISLGGSSLLTAGDCNPPRTFNDFDNFGESLIRWDELRSNQVRAYRDLVTLQGGSPATEPARYVRSNSDSVAASMEAVRVATSRALPIDFPTNTGFQSACKDAARILNAPELGVRFVYLELGGFDTHSGERTAMTNRLNDLNIGLTNLIQVAKLLGRWQDVVIVTMSEFGRTDNNNPGSVQMAGTDHGHGNAMLIAGGGIVGGIKSPPPQAGDWNNSYIPGFHVHFKQVFRELVAGMGYNPEAVFPNSQYTPQVLNLF